MNLSKKLSLFYKDYKIQWVSFFILLNTPLSVEDIKDFGDIKKSALFSIFIETENIYTILKNLVFGIIGASLLLIPIAFINFYFYNRANRNQKYELGVSIGWMFILNIIYTFIICFPYLKVSISLLWLPTLLTTLIYIFKKRRQLSA
jgi:hypothetical protein